LLKPRWLIYTTLALALFSLFTTTASAAVGVPVKTTLDACGYFYGYQTAGHADQDVREGVTFTKEHGTWTGVWNNFFNTPVASLGPVSGKYHDSHSVDAAGNISGVERFKSDAGNIDQVYAFTASTHTWNVDVVATGSLSFLTTNTNGRCYKGPFPRP
jgi:hypothetical protein